MKVAPISHSSAIKTDTMRLAIHATQHVADSDSSTKVTCGGWGAKSFRWLLSGRCERQCTRPEAQSRWAHYPLCLVVILTAITLALATGGGYSGSAVMAVSIGGS